MVIFLVLTDVIQDEVLTIRKTASKISRDVRKFWLKINKIIDFKQKAEGDEVRQKVFCYST